MSSIDDLSFDELFISTSPRHITFPSGCSPVNCCDVKEIDIGDEDDVDNTIDEEPQVFVDEAQATVPLCEIVSISNNINLESFIIRSLVGTGAYGKVRQVIKRDSQEVFAMKSLSKRHLINTNCVSHTMEEKAILREVRHPFIVRLHYAFQTPSKLHLIMDFVNGGHLLHHLRKETMFSEKQARFYIAEVILAIEHLHSLNIIHRDLKPENVLLSAEGHCVLTDFGFAKQNVTDPDSCESFCGTLEYMAPEVVKKNKYGKPADWWSVGVLLYDMLCGKPPFSHSNDAKLYQKILSDKLVIPKYFTGQCESLIRGLLQRDISKRLTVDKIKAHSFFKTIDWVQLGRMEIPPPFLPSVTKGALDTSNFDRDLTRLAPGESPASSPISNSMQMNFMGFSYVRSFEDRRLAR